MKIKRTILLFSIVLLIVLIFSGYILFNDYFKNAPIKEKTTQALGKIGMDESIESGRANLISPSNLKEKLEDQYNADRLSLFTDDFDGVYKKKIQIASEVRNALVLLPPERIEKTLLISPGTSFRFGFGIWEDSFRSDGIQLNLYLKNREETKKIYSHYIDPKHNAKERKWFDVNIDLKKYANQEITVLFEVLGSREGEEQENNREDFAVISDPQITLYKTKPDPGDYNVILISIDTLRADHLGCYGYKRKDISPHMDRLARSGILFENAISPCPWTIPSHISMLTSLLPSSHRINESWAKFRYFMVGKGKGYRILSENIRTLPEILRENGYKTFAITSGGTVAGKLGFFKGFDFFKEIPLLDNMDQIERFISENQNEKFFMFLHTMRVHAPYIDLDYAHEVMRKEETIELENFFQAFSEKSIKDISDVPFENDRVLIVAERKKLLEMGLFTKDVTEALYDGGIHKTDQFIGEFLRILEERGVLDHTIIVITSDHGEEFGDHNLMAYYDWHGRSMYEEMVRVPLIVFIPGNDLKGVKINSQVRLIDLMPTLLDFTGSDFDRSRMQGVSLSPILKGKNIEEELVAISEAICCGPESKSIRSGKFKYIYTIDMEDEIHGERAIISDRPDQEELYNILVDPREKHSIHPQSLNLSRTLRKEINKILEEALQMAQDAEDEKRIIVDEGMRRRLKALGYIK